MKLEKFSILMQVAEAVRREERNFQLRLGTDHLQAHHEAWAAYQGVIDIAAGRAPEVYCTTEAKIITGRGA